MRFGTNDSSPIANAFSTSQVSDSEDIVMKRIGYFGWKAARIIAGLNEEYGEGGWELRWKWGEDLLPFSIAIQIYEDAYFLYLQSHDEVLDALVSSASDVFDISPGDCDSGIDYTVQQHKAAHYQDIAIRRAVLRLGRRFQGPELLQVRGKDSPLYHLNPGVVPFHAPHLIEQPALSGWWDPDSIEDFYQSNKYVVSTHDESTTILRIPTEDP